jgi:hypothetical protein
MTPPARRPGLLVRELPDETLVYDLAANRAHCLNRSAGLVFRLCDGRRTPHEIAATLPSGSDEERAAAAGLALAELREAGLLAGDGAVLAPTDAALRDAAADEVSRRALLARLSATLLLPVVVSVLAPTPAQAASACVYMTDCGAGNVGQPCYCFPGDCPTNQCAPADVTNPSGYHCHPCDG